MNQAGDRIRLMYVVEARDLAELDEALSPYMGVSLHPDRSGLGPVRLVTLADAPSGPVRVLNGLVAYGLPGGGYAVGDPAVVALLTP